MIYNISFNNLYIILLIMFKVKLMANLDKGASIGILWKHEFTYHKQNIWIGLQY